MEEAEPDAELELGVALDLDECVVPAARPGGALLGEKTVQPQVLERGEPGQRGLGPGPAGRVRPQADQPVDDPQVGENTCPDCAGTGTRDGTDCPTCAGSGTVAEVVGDA